MRKGSYLLILALERAEELEVGRLGRISFPAGLYLYCGSALNGVEARVARHLRKEKRLHWHIDRLLASGEAVGALVILGEERLECRMADLLAEHETILRPINGFGCSDCSCRSHLFHVADEGLLEHVLNDVNRRIR